MGYVHDDDGKGWGSPGSSILSEIPQPSPGNGVRLVLDDDLAVEVAVVHGLVGRTHIEQREYAAGDAPEGAVANHLHKVGEGAVAAPSASHQVQGLALQQRQVEVGAGAGCDSGDNEAAA